jgi:hypothetical protein
VKAAAEEHEDSLAAHVLMSLLGGGTFNSDGEVEDPDYSPQVSRMWSHSWHHSLCCCRVLLLQGHINDAGMLVCSGQQNSEGCSLAKSVSKLMSARSTCFYLLFDLRTLCMFVR